MLQIVQYAGDVVHIGTGWLHQVENHLPSVKWSFDYIQLEQLSMASWVQRAIMPTATPLMNLPDDYSAVLRRVITHISLLQQAMNVKVLHATVGSDKA